MSINWNAVEREEDDLVDRLNAGEITQEEFNAEMREIRYSVQAAYEEERARALEQVEWEWGYR